MSCMATNITPDQRREFARRAQLNEQYLYQCLTGRRDMSADEAIRVEKALGGDLTRKELCPNVWKKRWPELADKPALKEQIKTADYAGPDRRKSATDKKSA